MEHNLHTRLLHELDRAGLPWEKSQNHDPSERNVISWIPIAALANARIELGLSSDGSWVRKGSESVIVFESQTDYVFLLPVLEVNLDDLRQILGRGFQGRGLAPEFVQSFPFNEVVATGLESHSEHWVDLALKWAEQLDLSVLVKNALSSCASGGPTQRLRQAAKKLIARRHGTDMQKYRSK